MNDIDRYVFAFKNGKKDCFEQIYNLTSKNVYLAISAYIYDKSIVEDLVQDAYMKIIKNLNSYLIGTNFYGFCVTVGKNTALDYLKKKKPIIIEETNVCFNRGAYSENDLLYTIFKLLSKTEYIIFIYHALLDFSYKSIAGDLNMKLQEVAYIYKKAKTKLKEEINI